MGLKVDTNTGVLVRTLGVNGVYQVPEGVKAVIKAVGSIVATGNGYIYLNGSPCLILPGAGSTHALDLDINLSEGDVIEATNTYTTIEEWS